MWADGELRLGYATDKVGMLLGSPSPAPGTPFTQAFEEFLGMEDTLLRVATGAQQSFAIEFIHRQLDNGLERYISFFFYPAPTLEGEAGLLVILEDATPMGELIQELRQKRNELRLLRERDQPTHS